MIQKYESGLWAKTIEVVKINSKFCLMYVGIMMAIGTLQDYVSNHSGFVVAQGLASAFLAIPAHIAVLRNDLKPAAADNKVLWRFFWRAFLLGAMSIVPAIIISLIFLNRSTGTEMVILYFIIALAFISPIVFAKWRTMLPASVINTDYSFSTAGRRGQKTFFFSLGRLYVSFVLLTMVILGVAMLLGPLMNNDGKFISSEGRPDLVAILTTLVINLIGAFQIVMTAVILSRAYLKAEDALSLDEPHQA